jgi:hypothetical protein
LSTHFFPKKVCHTLNAQKGYVNKSNLSELPLIAYKVPVFYWKVKENGIGVIDAIYKDRGVGDFWSIPAIEYTNMVKVYTQIK